MESIAIIGYGCVYPNDLNDTDKFWNMVHEGKNCIKDVPNDRWNWELYYSPDRAAVDKTYSIKVACIDNYVLNPRYTEILNRTDKKLNRMQIMILDTICQAMEKTKYTVDQIQNKKVALQIGNMLGDDSFADYSLCLRGKEIEESIANVSRQMNLDESEVNSLRQDVMGRINEKFGGYHSEYVDQYIPSSLTYLLEEVLGIKGGAMIVDGACSSSILVLEEAIKQLHENTLDMCVVSGALGSVNVVGSVGFSKIGGVNEGISRPMDHNTKGLNLSEGVGTILIKRLKDAVRDGDKIYSVITGIHSTNNGAGKSIYASSEEGQYDAMKGAISKAGLVPMDIDYIESHATGTVVGDVVELQSLSKLYEGTKNEGKTVYIGNVKHQIGHSFSAAGMANLIKVMESFLHDTMPATYGFEAFPDECNFEDTCLKVNTREQNWKRKDGGRRSALVNAFGFGGVNASAVIEEYVEGTFSEEEERVDYTDIDISIVGIGVMDGNIKGREQWMEMRCQDSQEYYPEKRWGKRIGDIYQEYLTSGSFIEDINFPCLKFRMPPLIIKQLDRAQQIALLTADEAINEVGIDNLKGKYVPVYVAKMMGTEKSSEVNIRIRSEEYISVLKENNFYKSLTNEQKENIERKIRDDLAQYVPAVEEDCLPGYMDNIVSGRISNKYDFLGPCANIDAGTSSFAVALMQAIDTLLVNDAEYALVGGMNANMSPEMMQLTKDYFETHQELGQKFEDILPAEGAAFYIIKQTKNVTEDEHIYARITALKMGQEKGSSSELSYQLSGKKPFYYGGEMAFQLLDAIRAIDKEGSSQRKAAFWVSGTGLMGNEYSMKVVSKEYVEPVAEPVTKQEAVSGKTKEVGGYKILRVTGTCLEDIQKKCRELLDANEEGFPDSNEEGESQLNIVYRNFEELKKKVELLLKYN